MDYDHIDDDEESAYNQLTPTEEALIEGQRLNRAILLLMFVLCIFLTKLLFG